MTVSDRFVDLAIVRQLLLQRVQAGAATKVDLLMRELAQEIEQMLSSNKPLTTYSQRRLESALREIKSEVAGKTAEAGSTLAQDLADLAGIEAEWTVAAVNSAATITLVAALPSSATLKSIAENSLVQGATIGDWFGKLDADLQFAIDRTVKVGVSLGKTNQQIAKEIIGIGDKGGEPLAKSRRDAVAITRTSVQTIANEASLAVYRANSDVIAGVVWLSTLDGRTTDICMARSGKQYTLEGEPVGHSIPFNGGPPAHWNCLPADARISACGRITGVSKRWIDADLVVIKVAAGNEIACTPNHPILTDRGWVAAHFINHADKIACGALAVREGTREWDDQNIVPTIKDVTEAFLAARKVLPVPVPLTAKDFHGDGADSEVAVVWSDRFLSGEFEARGTEVRNKSIFVNRAAAILSRLVGLSHFDVLLNGPSSAALSYIRRFGKFLAILEGGPAHSGELLLAPVSSGDAVLFKDCINGGDADARSVLDASDANTIGKHSDDFGLGSRAFPHIQDQGRFALGKNANSAFLKETDDDTVRDAKLQGDLLNGKYGLVAFNKIESIGKRAFSGHVYNLETVDGYYVANGIVTHNCRSSIVPKTKTFRELGIDQDELPVGTRASQFGTVPADLTFDDFLKRQPDGFADEMLGKGRAELWRKGTITLSQLLDQRGNPLTLQQLRARYQN